MKKNKIMKKKFNQREVQFACDFAVQP